MKRVCKNCGNVVKGKGRFCDKCGAELVDEMPVIEEDRTQPVNEIPAAEDANAQPVGEISAAPEGNSKQKKKRRWIIPLIAAVVVIAAAAVGAVFIFRSSANQYRTILTAARKTLEKNVSFSVMNQSGDSIYGQVEIDPDEGTVHFYVENDYGDSEVYDYEYGHGTYTEYDSDGDIDSHKGTDDQNMLSEALLTFVENGDTEEFYKYLPYTDIFQECFKLDSYDVDTDILADVGHKLYQELSTEDTVIFEDVEDVPYEDLSTQDPLMVLQIENNTQGKKTCYTFSPYIDDDGVMPLWEEILTLMKPLYTGSSNEETYNAVATTTPKGYAEFWVDSDGYLKAINILVLWTDPEMIENRGWGVNYLIKIDNYDYD